MNSQICVNDKNSQRVYQDVLVIALGIVSPSAQLISKNWLRWQACKNLTSPSILMKYTRRNGILRKNVSKV